MKVTAWDDVARIVQQFCVKGTKVRVVGRLKQSDWTDRKTGESRSGLRVSATEVSLVRRRPSSYERKPDWDSNGAAEDASDAGEAVSGAAEEMSGAEARDGESSAFPTRQLDFHDRRLSACVCLRGVASPPVRICSPQSTRC